MGLRITPNNLYLVPFPMLHLGSHQLAQKYQLLLVPVVPGLPRYPADTLPELLFSLVDQEAIAQIGSLEEVALFSS